MLSFETPYLQVLTSLCISWDSCGYKRERPDLNKPRQRGLSELVDSKAAEELMFLNCGIGEDSWESLGLQGDPTSPFWRRSALGFLWKEWCESWNSSTWATWGQEEKGMTEDEMAGWHHWLDGHESKWTLGVGDGEGGLVCCDSWGRKESDTTERLNWTELTELALTWNVSYRLLGNKVWNLIEK